MCAPPPTAPPQLRLQPIDSGTQVYPCPAPRPWPPRCTPAHAAPPRPGSHRAAAAASARQGPGRPSSRAAAGMLHSRGAMLAESGLQGEPAPERTEAPPPPPVPASFRRRPPSISPPIPPTLGGRKSGFSASEPLRAAPDLLCDLEKALSPLRPQCPVQ